MITLSPPLHDCAPDIESFEAEALSGLSALEKTLPCKYFYDAYGSALFDRICDLPEYYPTRTETAIMQQNADEIAALIRSGSLLIEYGSGSSVKTRILLDRLPRLAGYVPMDISREHLQRTAARLAEAYPHLDVLPLCADYTAEFTLPAACRPVRSHVVYFPGSTIGNFHPDDARTFLTHIAEVCGPDGGLLIGVDLKKEAEVLNAAYNDAQGVTAAFNLNLLTRMNAELGADFDLTQFAHRAFYNTLAGRIEMHLMSLTSQIVRLGGAEIQFGEEESILTECSYKYSLADFAGLAESAGLQVRKVWTDTEQRFSVQYLTPKS